MKEHSVRKLPALNTNIGGYRWTGEHVHTQTHTHTPVSDTVSLSFVNSQTVSSEKWPLNTNVTKANGDIKDYWTKASGCSLHREPTASEERQKKMEKQINMKTCSHI